MKLAVIFYYIEFLLNRNCQKILFTDIQSKTKEAIWRIQQQTAEAEGVGNETLQELRRQGQQMVTKKFI